MKKGKQYRRILSGVLALCMVVVFLPFSALAENSNSPEAPISKIISAFAEPDTIELSIGDTQTEQEIIATFPNDVSATVDGTEGSQVPVTSWVRVFPTVETAFSTAQAGEFYYEPTLAEGYTLEDTATLPNQLVKVGEVVHAPQATVGTGAESFSFQVTVTDSDPTFSIPLSGGSGTDSTAPSYGKPYNWSIDWGDNTDSQTAENSGSDDTKPQNAVDSDGIPHTYTTGGTYTITITNNASNANGIANNDAWLAAFGFDSAPSYDSANNSDNKQKVVAILSGFTPFMTRTQAQITSSTPQVHYEWADAFAGCTNLTSIGSGFSSGWESVASIGNYFAYSMFHGCTNLQSMGANFNMPQSVALTSIGDYFAYSMFHGCTNLQSMGASFTMPQSDVLAEIGDYFAYYMFLSCTNLQSMGASFTMPQSDVLAEIGDYFAYYMFYKCTNLQSMGASFTMPQSDVLAEIGDYFAYYMFYECTNLQSMGASFTMPQSAVLAEIGDYFAAEMFYKCTSLQSMGANFNMPQSAALTSIGNSFASYMFYYCTNLQSMGASFTMPQSAVLAEIGDYFAAGMFYECKNLQSMGDNFTMPQSDALTSIGNSFASYMFYDCTKLQSMGANFNMPQSAALTSIGDSFATSMFSGCETLSGMSANFNMPQSAVLAEIGNSFANSMFSGCKTLSGMGANFNMPQSAMLAEIGYDFARSMFSDCTNLQSMGANFNLPQSAVLAKVGNNFASSMFYRCTNLESISAKFNMPQSDALTSIGNDFATTMFYECKTLSGMGANFNLPQSAALTSIGDFFAAGMFEHAGTNLVINEVFRFTQGVPTQNNSAFIATFNGAGLAAGQSRSAQSIINGNDTPSSERNTFTGQDDAFSDLAIVPINWGGDDDKPDYMVTFINDTGVTATYMPPQQGVANDNPTGKPAKPEATNYTFVAWYTDSALTNAYDFTQNVNGDLNLYAKFEGNPYTLSFDDVGGVMTPNNMSVTYNSQLGTLPTPTKTGYTFGGWTINGQAITSATVWNYTENKTAVANWTINRYTVSFDTNGGSAVNAQTVDYNTAITKPSSPTKTDNKFVAWYTDSALTTEYNFTTPITANMTLYAKWQSTPTIINGANQTITRGQSINFTSSDDFDGYVDTVITLSDGTKHTVHTAGNNNENASAVGGSIVITLSGTYTSTLPIGTHSISINSANGSAMANFTVVATPTPGTDTPETGEQDNTPLVSATALISVLGMLAMLLYRKKWITARKK